MAATPLMARGQMGIDARAKRMDARARREWMRVREENGCACVKRIDGHVKRIEARAQREYIIDASLAVFKSLNPDHTLQHSLPHHSRQSRN